MVSEFRRPKPHGAAIAWLKAVDTLDLYLSAMTLGEIQAGIERMRTHNPAKAQELENWADEIAMTYQILPIDVEIIRLWAKFMRGRPATEFEDMMIGATAFVAGLTLVTRNVKDFSALGLVILNPFEFGGGS